MKFSLGSVTSSSVSVGIKREWEWHKQGCFSSSKEQEHLLQVQEERAGRLGAVTQEGSNITNEKSTQDLAASRFGKDTCWHQRRRLGGQSVGGREPR